MSNLLPCPFCGSTDIDSEPNTDTYGSVCCNKCGFGSPYGEISIMIERWNSRPLEDALQARIAELEAEKEILNRDQNILLVNDTYRDGDENDKG